MIFEEPVQIQRDGSLPRATYYDSVGRSVSEDAGENASVLEIDRDYKLGIQCWGRESSGRCY